MLAVNADQAVGVLRLNEDEHRAMQQNARRALSTKMQEELEARIAAMSAKEREQYEKELAATETRWRSIEEQWASREAELKLERTRLAAERDAAVKKLEHKGDGRNEYAERLVAEREELLRMHAAALEEAASHNNELRRECSRLHAQQLALEREMRQAEHETRLETMEAEEAVKAMSSAVRELVPLRQEVLEHRAQAIEWSRAAAQLKAAQEEDQASFLIAKKTAARMIRKKHMKALDEMMVKHKQELSSVEDQREQEAQHVEELLASQVSSTEAKYKEELRKQKHEELERRRQLQEDLRRQLEGEAQVATSGLQSEYEETLRMERMAASAKLVQKQHRMNHQFQTESSKMKEQQQRATAGELQRYAEEAAAKVASANARADRFAAEFSVCSRELARIHAGFDGVPDKLQSMLKAEKEGWEACEIRLSTALEESREWRSKFYNESNLLKLAIERHRGELMETRVRAACDAAAFRGELAELDQQLPLLGQWKVRAENMAEELGAVKKSYSNLMAESKQKELEWQKEKQEREKEARETIKKLTDQLDKLRKDLAAKMEEAARNKGLADRLKETNEKLQTETVQAKAEKREAENYAAVIKKIATAELRQDDLEKSRDLDAEQARLLQVRREGASALAGMLAEVELLESQLEAFARRFSETFASLQDELSNQRKETRKVRLLVDNARKAEEAALQKLEEEKERARQELAAMREEMMRNAAVAAKEVDKARRALVNEEEDHDMTRKLLADERHMRKTDAVEMERLKRLAEEAERLVEVCKARVAEAEAKLETVVLEAADAERALSDHLAEAMDQLMTRCGKLPGPIDALLDPTLRIDEAIDAQMAEWKALMDARAEQHSSLQADRDELQARFDWLLVRWTGREPRQQDVSMMTKLQEELSRQMHMTANAVQAAREYKAALATNDAAYTRLFGLGSLLPEDYVALHNEGIHGESELTDRPPTAPNGSGRNPPKALSGGGCSRRPQSAAPLITGGGGVIVSGGGGAIVNDAVAATMPRMAEPTVKRELPMSQPAAVRVAPSTSACEIYALAPTTSPPFVPTPPDPHQQARARRFSHRPMPANIVAPIVPPLVRPASARAPSPRAARTSAAGGDSFGMEEGPRPSTARAASPRQGPDHLGVVRGGSSSGGVLATSVALAPSATPFASALSGRTPRVSNSRMHATRPAKSVEAQMEVSAAAALETANASRASAFMNQMVDLQPWTAPDSQFS